MITIPKKVRNNLKMVVRYKLPLKAPLYKDKPIAELIVKKNDTNTVLSKFNLYCLINNEKFEEAQLIFDLKKELGFKDEYFEKKINYLFGYTENLDTDVSVNSILDFHLAHRTNPNFIFEPKKILIH